MSHAQSTACFPGLAAVVCLQALPTGCCCSIAAQAPDTACPALLVFRVAAQGQEQTAAGQTASLQGAQDLDVSLLTLTSHQQILSHRQADPLARDDQQTPLENNGSCSLPRDSGKAQKSAQAATQYAASLLARAVKAWQMMTSQAVALLFQQHELKAEANQQLLQV